MKDSSKKVRILVVDDSPDTLEVLKRNLESEGYTVITAPGAVEAIKIIESSPVDLVITDLKMPEVDGLSLVRHIQENYKNMGVMMITGYPSIEGAVEAVKSGAEEYLSKPFTDEELSSAVKRSLDKLFLRRISETQSYRPPESRQGLIGESNAMQKIWLAIEKASQSHATVLITGESGTGKELVARAIHYSSARSPAPFVPSIAGVSRRIYWKANFSGMSRELSPEPTKHGRASSRPQRGELSSWMKPARRACPCRSNSCAFFRTKKSF